MSSETGNVDREKLLNIKWSDNANNWKVLKRIEEIHRILENIKINS